MNGMIGFENVCAGYGKIKVLDNLSFDAKQGEIFGVIGPNGSGKTTMLAALAGQIRLSSGRIIFDGGDISGLKPHCRCRMGIGRTFQVPRPFAGMTVFENVLAAAVHGAGLNRKEAAEAAEDCLETVGLADKSNAAAGELTLLDSKKLEAARALGTRPRLLLLDETAAGLTEAETEEIIELALKLKKRGLTIIWIEHILEVMRYATDMLMCMAEGRNVICGTPEEVMGSDIVEEIYLGSREQST